MRRDVREVIADWLILLGAVILLAALFLPWSHQLSAGSGPPVLVRGVPRDPTAWQVYSLADIGLALVAGWLVLVAMIGGRIRRLVALVAAGIALVFAVHAHAVPPTSGAPASAHPTPGRGETVALVGLGMSVVGLVLSFTAD